MACSLSPEIQKAIVDGLLGIFGDSIDSIILYGSVARGDDGPESDVDVAFLINGDIEKTKHREFISWNAELDLTYDKVFSILDINTDNYRMWKDILPFYRNVVKDGIVLWKAA